MNRRAFLAGSVGALAAAPPPPSDQIVVGVVGAGFRGMQLIHACLDQPSIRIGAVCETYEPRMFGAGAITRARGHKTRYYRIYQDLVEDRDLDAVIVATPDFSHHTITMEALKAGKHVYVEQPLCLSWQQGVELLNAEREFSRVVQVGSQRRSSPIYIEAARRISAGALGRVQMGRSYCVSNSLRPGVLKRGGVKLPEPLNFFDWQAGAAERVPFSVDRFLNWRYYSEYGGGAVADLGCRVIDGIHMLTGANFPATVKASGIPASAEGFDTVERAAITVEYPGGQLVTLSLNAGATIYREDRWELTSIDCEAGRAEITPREYTDWKMSTSGKAGLTVPSWQRRIANASDVATRAHIANFLNAVRGKESAHAPVSAAFGGTLVCQMANLSIRTGRTAHWNSTDQRVEIS
jgi:predicted dehydrogenase